MAELTTNPFTPNQPTNWNRPWNSAQTAAQFRAIAWLRWRVLVNSFRRKGGAGELVGRIILYPFLFLGALFPSFGVGFAAWYFAANDHLARISLLLWATFILCQLLNINIGQPGTTFNPNELIRFPLRLRSFVLIRLFFGLLSPANVMVSLMSLAIAIGIIVAEPSLWLYALLALGVFAAANILFTRMVFAWVDRWLSTRRARELFTLLIFTVSIGFQWANVTFNPAYNGGWKHHHSHAQAVSRQRIDSTVHLYQRVHPFVSDLPPELTGSALSAANRHQSLPYTGAILGTAAYALLFLAIFTLRMRTEYRGEALSDVANAISRKKTVTRTVTEPSILRAEPSVSHRSRTVVGIVFSKEILYIRRNTGLLYTLVVPVVMIFLFAGRMSARSNSVWVFPACIAYTLLTLMPLTYNVFGLEGTGAQFYFMAPIRLREVFVAKNLIHAVLASIEITVVFAVVTYITGRPSLQIIGVTLLWAAATFLIGLTIGNLRSVSAPKRIEFARTAGKQASPVSAFMSIGILLGLAGLGAGLISAARFLHVTWALVPAFAALLAAAIVVYVFGLKQIERYTLEHREELFTELSKR
jgi:ABC-2 type transport system permease protein